MADPMFAFGDDLHGALREAALVGPVVRDPETGVAIALRHADVEALGRDPRMVGVGLGNFDAVGITEGPLREWYGQLMFTNEGAAHRRLRSARATGVHAAGGRRDPVDGRGHGGRELRAGARRGRG